MKQEFSGEPVTVILDRRQGERRETGQPNGEDRPGVERRARPDVDAALEARGFVVIATERPRPSRRASAALGHLGLAELRSSCGGARSWPRAYAYVERPPRAPTEQMDPIRRRGPRAPQKVDMASGTR